MLAFTLPSTFYLQISVFREPTRGLEPLTCSLRVITQALLGFAEACKPRIFRGVSFLRLAEYCTVLRSRWYQSGINTVLVATSDQEIPRVGPTTAVAMPQGPRHRLGRDAGNVVATA